MKHLNKSRTLWFAGSLKDESGGVALVLVVWIIIVLTTIVGEFAYTMRTEINIARNFKEEEEAYQLALAGFEQAKIELLSAKMSEIMYRDEDGVLNFGEEEVQPERKGELGNGTYEYSISDEDGKLNINTASEAQLKGLFSNSGIEFTDVEVIVDSILDWKDGNDLHRLNGAEEDYYRSLDNPYSCKDDRFNTVEELIMVKGIDEVILYGTKENQEEDDEVYTGVANLVTVYGTKGLNINTASEHVLNAVMDPASAQRVISMREAGPIYNNMRISTGKVSSEYFTILSTGMNMDGSVKRTVKSVVRLKENDVETLYWNDNFIG